MGDRGIHVALLAQRDGKADHCVDVIRPERERAFILLGRSAQLGSVSERAGVVDERLDSIGSDREGFLVTGNCRIETALVLQAGAEIIEDLNRIRVHGGCSLKKRDGPLRPSKVMVW
jgi:hypothetical protein